MNKKIESNQIYDICKNHMHAYVLIETTDGKKHDGIITGLDDQHVYLAVPIGEGRVDERKVKYGSSYGNPSFGGSYYGGNPYYGGGPYYGAGPYGGYFPPRRFQRLVLPLTALAALSLLPWY